MDIVTALSSNRRIISREQQDAQEFFQLVSSEIETESQKIQRTEMLGGGLKDLLDSKLNRNVITGEQEEVLPNDHIENPFTGLLANRLSCMQCGYTVIIIYITWYICLFLYHFIMSFCSCELVIQGAIRHFTFNNIQLNVPNKVKSILKNHSHENFSVNKP
jgi:ubiquitin carboxyl-terminal hydrolase 1